MTSAIKDAKKATAYFQEGSDLQTLLAKIDSLRRLHEKVMVFIDPHLKDYCQVANLINGKLIMVVANSSVATYIRFRTYDLLEKFKQLPALASIQQIECKVRPAQSLPPRFQDTKQQKMPLLSPQTATIILEIANSISDPTIKEILLRIADRT